MDLSERERRLLGEIEQNLRRRDRAFACRMHELNAASARQGPQRFACHTTHREIACALLAVVIVAALSMLVVLTAGRTRTPPGLPTPAPGRPSVPLTSAPASGHRTLVPGSPAGTFRSAGPCTARRTGQPTGRTAPAVQPARSRCYEGGPAIS